MKEYKKIYKKGNMYFDTYYIYDEVNGCYVGILEDHRSQVKNQYFVGWHYEGNFAPDSFQPGKTNYFRKEEAAMAYITDNYTK